MMIVDPLSITSPAVLREQKRVEQAQRFSGVLGGLSLVQLGLSIWYEDYKLVALFGVLALMAAAASRLYPKMSSGLPHALYLININISIVVVQVMMPADVSGLVMLMAFGLTCFASVKTTLEATLCMIFAISARYGLTYFGVTVGMPSSVPMTLSFVASVVSIGIMVVAAIRLGNEEYERSRQRLQSIELSLLREQELLNDQSVELQSAAVELEKETSELDVKLFKEGELRGKLTEKQGDEERLVHAIHHDLREPLRTIVSFGQLLQRKLSSSEGYDRVEDYLNFAIDGGHRMTQMLEDLLVYAQSDLDQPREEINLNELVASIHLDITDLIQRKNARVEINPLPIVHGYAAPLRQLLLNLLNNALKFSRPGVPPVVKIFSVTEGNSVLINIVDNGIGIPENQIEHVFGLFNRAHEKEDYAGSGVGLALCRRVAIAHGAKLTVHSIMSEGSTFSLSLPPHLIVSGIKSETVTLNEYKEKC